MTIEKARESWLWRSFTAMITENKAGVMALSFTRCLAMVTFVAWLVLEILFTTGVTLEPPTTSMVTILVSLIGIKGIKDSVVALKGQSVYTNLEESE